MNCVSGGCENVPATTMGVYDDGEERDSKVFYCAECTEIMVESGQYVVTQNLDPHVHENKVLQAWTELRALRDKAMHLTGYGHYGQLEFAGEVAQTLDAFLGIVPQK